MIVIGSPESARAWCRVAGRGDVRVDDVVIFGAGRMGTTIAGALLERDIRVRLVDAQRERVLEVAAAMPEVRAFHAHAFDPEFLDRERIGRTRAAVFCLNDDAKNLYGAILAKGHGVRLTIALVHDQISVDVYERGGVDVAIIPGRSPPRRWSGSRTTRASARSQCSRATASRSSTSPCGPGRAGRQAVQRAARDRLCDRGRHP